MGEDIHRLIAGAQDDNSETMPRAEGLIGIASHKE